MSAPTVAQLRALVALADTLQFREAAASLGVSQPSVSEAIRSLESALGAPLAQRSSRRVVLTPAGQEVAARARDILAGIDGLAGAVPGASARQGTLLRLGLIPTVAPYILAPVLRAMARRLPELRPDVTEDQTARLVERLLDGSLDAALLALPSGVPGLEELPLYWEDFLILVPPGHPLAGRSDVGPRVLRDLRLLLLEEGHCLSAQVIDVCEQAGAGTDHPARAASLTTVAQLVAAGLGATLLPATALPVETRKGKLAVARFRSPVPGRTIGLAYAPGQANEALMGRLADHIRRALDRPGFGGRVIRPSPGRQASAPSPGGTR